MGWAVTPSRIERRRRALLVAAICALVCAHTARTAEWNTRLDIQARGFLRSPAFPRQTPHGASLAWAPEFSHVWADGDRGLTVEPYVRLDSADRQRSVFDVREMMYQHFFGEAELRVGVGRVFWGVAESLHLIDTINQTDYLDDLDGETKLGQPMINLSLIRNWGVIDLFALPGFRERPFPGPGGRLRTQPVVDVDRASFERGDGPGRTDYAVRWSHAFDALDIGLAHFHGTARDPRLSPACVAPRCDPATGDGFVLTPRYETTRRNSLDLQYTGDATLWKLEALHESRRAESWHAWVAGLEHTWYGALPSGIDLALFVEHLRDSRGAAAPQPFEDDAFAGVRLAFNNAANSDILIGAIADLDDRSTVFVVEASHRLADRWSMAINARVWTGVERGDPMYPLRQDDYVELTLSRYF